MSSLNTFFIEWEDQYSVGVPAIDQQHRYLITIIRELQEAMVAGRTAEVLSTLIHKLVTYTNYHFTYEETLYHKQGYAEIEDHKKLHGRMVAQVMKMEEAASAGRLRTGAPLIAFLKRWLTDHILGEDQQAFQKVLARSAPGATVPSGDKVQSADKN